MTPQGAILPESTPLFIGAGVVIEGTIRYDGVDINSRIKVVGEVRGDIYTSGILEIAPGAQVNANSKIVCREIIVAGKIAGEGVTVRANTLILLETGNVAVEMVCLPLGGLEQNRGGILNARLDMSAEYGESEVTAPKPAAIAAEVKAVLSAVKPTLAVVPELGVPATLTGEFKRMDSVIATPFPKTTFDDEEDVQVVSSPR